MKHSRKNTPLPDWHGRHFPIHSRRPDAEYLERWRDYIKKTGRPEMFEGVSTTPAPPEFPLELLSIEIPVPIAKREDQDKVPCPVCSPDSPKFTKGRMAYFPMEKVVRFIGHKCAASHFRDGHYRMAEEEYRREQQRIACQEFLRKNAGKLPEIVSAGKSLLRIAHNAKQVHGHMVRHRDLAQFLRNKIRVDDGKLSVFEIIPEFARANPMDRTREVTFGYLRGKPAVANSFDAPVKIANSIKALDDFLPLAGEDVATKIDTMPEAAQDRAYTAILSNYNVLARQAQKLAEFVSFFDGNNIRALRNWGEHRDAPTRISAYMRQSAGEQQLCIDWDSRSIYLRVPLPSALFERPQLLPRITR
ncbi:hypothetical protein [Pyruvatibacter mobilis]|uniref:hypothetical protein n=1 Tax=Pyruvatibacter mobilis TaxID=1712261 RepID=UPI003C7A9042